MTQITCPSCGASASGNFCATCGAALGTLRCPACGAVTEPGARFCTTCGASLGGGDAPPGGSAAPGHGRVGAQAAAATSAGNQMGWWMAGGMLVFLLAVLAYPVLVPQQTREQNPGPTGGALSETQPFGDARSVDLSSMTPIQAANQLFNRVMGHYEAGDTTQVAFFLPMSISAYQQAEPLDADGLYDLSTLHRVAGQVEEALAASQRILDATPTHLFGLHATAEAYVQLGDTARAREHYQAVLDSWADEQASPRSEYQMRPAMMPMIYQAAEAFLGN